MAIIFKRTNLTHFWSRFQQVNTEHCTCALLENRKDYKSSHRLQGPSFDNAHTRSLGCFELPIFVSIFAPSIFKHRNTPTYPEGSDEDGESEGGRSPHDTPVQRVDQPHPDRVGSLLRQSERIKTQKILKYKTAVESYRCLLDFGETSTY